MIVPVPQFTAPSYGDRTLNEVQRCVNLYPEKTASGWVLVSTPGLGLFATTANDAACRGAFWSSIGTLFSVHGNVLYVTGSNGAMSNLGTLAGSSGQVYMADNGLQLFLTDGGSGANYTYTFSTGTITAVADANCPTGSMVTFQDGYFILGRRNTGEFYLSALYDGTDWTPIQFATAENQGDTLTGVYSNGQNLFLVGQKTVEVWYNTGNPDFPFERINGATVQIGCVQAPSMANINGILFFYGSSIGGKGAVWQFSGTSPKKISTPYIESIFAAYDVAGVFGITYQIDGHTFYQITATNAINAKTFVYDVFQETWFQKESDVSSAYTWDRLRFVINAFDSFACPIGFDSYNGRMYKVGGDPLIVNVNTENGTAIRRQRVFGPIESDTKRVFHSQIRFEIEWKSDATGTTSLAPTLDWTDDGGLTYSTPITMTKTVTSSTTGQRVIFIANRLGSSVSRYYRLNISGPAKIILKKCELDLKEGRF